MVESIRDRSRPVAFPVTFRQRPNLIASVVDPFALFHRISRREIFSFVVRIDKQVAVLPERNLHQPAPELGNHRKLLPVIGQLFSFPPAKGRGLHAARGMPSPRVDCETEEPQANRSAQKNSYSRA